LQRRVRKGGRRPTDRELHRIRIGAKQLRNASEMADPVVGARARRTAEAKKLRRRWRSAWTVLDDNDVLRWLKK
jgi:CHAD domain-containing protein